MSVALALIVLLAVGLRLHRLGDIPVFYDEDRYAYVAYEMTRMPWPDALGRPMNYLETGVARAPLVLVAQALLTKLTDDAIMAGRLISITSAGFTTLLSFWVGLRLGGAAVGIVTSVLYAVSPVSILHEQMGLQDGPLAAVSLAAVLTGVRAIGQGSWPAALIACVLGAIAVQCKPPGVALALMPPALVLLWPHARQRLAQAALISTGPVLSYATVAFGPLGASMAEENRRIRLIQPLETLPANLITGTDTLLTYFSIGVLLCMVAGRVIAGRQAPREAVAFSWAILVFLVPWLILSRFVPSRYYVPVVPYLCAFAAVALVRLPEQAWGRWRWVGALAALGSATLVLQQASLGFSRVTEPRSAPLSRLDVIQYRSGWPAGYSYLDAAKFVRTSLDGGADIAYYIDPARRMGAGVLAPLPDGVRSLGVFDSSATLPRTDGRSLVIVDDSTLLPTQAVTELMQRNPSLQTLARFENPDSSVGVSVLIDGNSR